MKKNGFTLIELLAVIVILAIIAMIATPMILGVIEKAKVGAAESSATGYVDAIEKQSIVNLTNGGEQYADGIYDVPMSDVSVKGTLPTSGWIKIEKGKVTDYSFVINGYVVTQGTNTVKGDTAATKPAGDVIKCSKGNACSVGDKVTVGGVEWYVIKDSDANSSEVTLLKATNTDSNTYAFDTSNARTTANNSYCITPSYGCNAYSKVEGIFTNGSLSGTVTEDSTIKGLVDTYINTLNLGTPLKEARLITKEELESLGCSSIEHLCSSAPTWVYSINYWANSPIADNTSDAWSVLANGSFGNNGASYSILFGVRPVIEVSKSAIIK